jgi:hypothetical protein
MRFVLQNCSLLLLPLADTVEKAAPEKIKNIEQHSCHRVYFVQSDLVFNLIVAYRDDKVVGVFVRFFVRFQTVVCMYL